PLDLDPTPTGVAMQLGVFVWAMDHKHFLMLSPFARHRAVDSIEDALFILDAQDRVVDINAAAATLIQSKTDNFLGKPLNSLLPAISGDLDRDLPRQVKWPDGRVMVVNGPKAAIRHGKRQG